MAQYKQSDITNIFWASNEGFKGGRDPMGIQNSSIATYSKLLPGLTNLTRHIRYYSLYCWLLSEYDELEKDGNITLHQYNFIRRAELAMALIMKDQEVGAVIGSMFVSQERYKIIEDGVYNIADGADYESVEKYWTFKSGAFGQYYMGSLIYYELVKIEEGRFYLRNKGKDLAIAFRKSVDKDIRDFYLECIQEGSLSKDDIDFLQPLAINRIVEGSEEWRYLNHLLTKEDEDSSFRKETIYLFLRDIEKGISVDGFVKNRFLHVEDDKEIEASFGWYFYYLCECLHYSIDSLFCLILAKIHDLHNPPMQLLSQEIVNSFISCIAKQKKFNTVNDWRISIHNDIDNLFEELKIDIRKQNYIQSAVHSIMLMLRLYTEYQYNKQDILDFETRNDLSRQRGILSKGLYMYVGKYLSSQISEYVESLITQIMQEHTLIAIAKMGNTNSDLRKFIYDDGRLFLVEQRYPVETSPRIDSLLFYLQDMGYLNNDNTLTDIAQQYIINYGKE